VPAKANICQGLDLLIRESRVLRHGPEEVTAESLKLRQEINVVHKLARLLSGIGLPQDGTPRRVPLRLAMPKHREAHMLCAASSIIKTHFFSFRILLGSAADLEYHLVVKVLDTDRNSTNARHEW